MKYIKKILLLLLVLSSMLLLGSPKTYAHNNDSNRKEPLEEEILKNTQATELAVTLNNVFQENTFSKSNENSYSGVYIDEDDIVTIGIKIEGIQGFEQHLRNTKSIIDNYTDSEEVKFIGMKFSLMELINVKDQIIDIREFFDFGVYSVSIVQKLNKVVVVLNDLKYSVNLINELINRINNFNSNILQIEVKDKDSTLKVDTIRSSEEIRHRTNFLFIWITQWKGTIGFNATRNGVKGIVTNKHVAPLNHAMYTSSNKYIGKSSVAIFNGEVDASFVPFDNQNGWDTTYELPYVPDVTPEIGWTSVVAEGTKIKSHGITTGVLYGQVQSIYHSENINDNGVITFFTDLIKHNIPIQGGDSGGPILLYYPKSIVYGLAGLNFAGNGTTGLAIKIDKIIDQLGIIPVTKY